MTTEAQNIHIAALLLAGAAVVAQLYGLTMASEAIVVFVGVINGIGVYVSSPPNASNATPVPP
jgi:hypothetical protein